jgi:hypothetical protein
MNNRFQMELFGRHHRKTFTQAEAHLVPENAQCAGSGAVLFLYSFL